MCSSSGKPVPGGLTSPRTLQDVLRWPFTFLSSFRDFDAKHSTGYHSELCRNVVGRPGIVLTTSFSGSGGAETALAMLRAAVKDANAGADASGDNSHTEMILSDDDEAVDDVGETLQQLRGIVMFAATDNARLSQRVLQAHPSDSAPLHIFGDVLDCLPVDVLKRCKEIETNKLQHFNDRAAEIIGAAVECADSEDLDMGDQRVTVMKAELGEELVNELCAELEKVHFTETAWCKNHQKFCYTNPRCEPIFRDAVWIEAAGPLCPPWSNMNPRKDRWLSEATLTSLTWAYSTRYQRPDIVLHENSPGWDDSRTCKVFAFKHTGKRASPSHPICSPFAKVPNTELDDSTGYLCLQPHIVCPSLMGIPSRRRRKYTAWTRKATVTWQFPASMVFQELFDTIFFRDLVSTAAVYLCASEGEVHEEAQAVLQGNGFDIEDGDITGDMVLSPGDFRRLQGHLAEAQDRGYREGQQWHVSCAIVNTGQTSGYMKAVDTVTTPALMRRSSLFDMVSKRILTKSEYWMIQGWPHPNVVGPPLASLFPFADMQLTVGQVRHLTGNGMHLACVGAMLSVVLACTSK
jgi:hypothetical protein